MVYCLRIRLLHGTLQGTAVCMPERPGSSEPTVSWSYTVNTDQSVGHDYVGQSAARQLAEAHHCTVQY